MSNALRDQLLKAGLVNEKQAKQAAKEKQKEAKRQHGQKPSADAEQERLRAQRAQAEKVERDRQLNQQRQADAERKALQAQIRQLVEAHRVAKGESETPFNFADGGKVKRLYVSDPNRERIIKGLLAIVRLESGYELVPAEIADKLRARSPDSVVLQHAAKPPAEEPPADDPYAQYQVPDDLMW
ncbi:DUF2058 domain-containing protein [Methylococcus sp. EFPC2]|uniref:DUF2058 domain-containing protein n=1 Tax=Methylococcus sp. EFPC2 TaxID=2812648 RepID=UPI001966EF2B|nr:DUF2058 domain-containing protein [Methylococcus sp. EFPC2]QSA98835.1 DUF2058 domain-containing protein [Methylococcus sp. EFPC2]